MQITNLRLHKTEKHILDCCLEFLKWIHFNPPQISFLYDDKDLFDKYKSYFKELKVSVPNIESLQIKYVDSNMLITEYGWNNKCDILIGKPDEDYFNILTDIKHSKINPYLKNLSISDETQF